MNGPNRQSDRAAASRDAKPTAANIAWRVARLPLVAYLGLLLVMVMLEESFIYFPARYPDGDWRPPALTFEDAEFTSADGTRLHGWYVPCENPSAVVLFAHGNAGNLTHRAEVLRQLHSLGAAVMIFDYRGYGKSEGSPSEQGILADARGARTWLARRTGRAEREIVLMGRSLGGAVAVDLAADGAAGLVLESTFTSMPDVAATVYPWLPVRMLMRTRLNSEKKILQYDGPLLDSHGEADEIIPIELGRRLFDVAPGKDKQFLAIPANGHNDWMPESYYTALGQFLRRVGGGRVNDE